MGYSFGGPIVTDGLTLCLDAADRNSYPGSGTTWADLSSLGNNGTLSSNTDFVTRTNGTNKITFNNSEKVNIGDSNKVVIGTNVTYDAWFTTTSIARGYLFSNVRNSSASSNLSLAINAEDTDATAGHVSWYVRHSGGLTYLNAGDVDINDGKWKNLTCTTTDAAQVMYLNGEVIQTGTVSFTNVASTDDAGLMNHADDSIPLPGDLACARIYQKTLTPEEVKQNFNAQRSRFGI